MNESDAEVNQGANSPAASPAGPTAENYTAAMNELRHILAALEQEDADVEELAKHVERAGHLIAFCRDRINHAEMRVEKVLASLAEQQDEDSDPPF